MLWWGGGAVAGYVLMMWTNPVRPCLRDGWRAIRRYPRLWLTMGGFWFFHAVFRLGERAYLHWLLPPESRPEFLWTRAAWDDPKLWLTGSPESAWWLPRSEFAGAVQSSFTPALEQLAVLFNYLPDTFPFSALAALFFVFNWHGYQRALWQALSKRYGWIGRLVHLAILVFALAAVAKPLAYGAVHWVPLRFWMQWSQVVAWLSFGFEYSLGVCVQLYLIFVAYAWVRGISVEPRRVFTLAVRRFAVVLKWAALLFALSTVAIDLPLLAQSVGDPVTQNPQWEELGRRIETGRLLIAVLTLCGAGIQIALALHTRSFWRATRDHFRRVFRGWWTYGWFFFLAAFHFFALCALLDCVARGVGEGTALWVSWRLFSPWLAAGVNAWLLASWVCLYQQCGRSRSSTVEPVRY
ncbi:MAG: hypothetical protein ABI680_05035 [Chthoniobacteraceae bacterium]